MIDSRCQTKIDQIEISISKLGGFVKYNIKTGTNLSLRAKKSKIKYMKKIKTSRVISLPNNGLSASSLASGKSTTASD